MSKTENPAEVSEDAGKFKPKSVAGDDDHGRAERNMKDVPRGSEGDRRRSAQNRMD